MSRWGAAIPAAFVVAGMSACLGTGTRRIDAACREMRSTVVYEMLRDNPTIKLVDLRDPAEVTPGEGRLPNARAIPLENLGAHLGELGDKGQETVVVFGRRAEEGRRGCQFLASQGFRYVIYIADGAEGWFRSGLPAAAPTPTPPAGASR